MLADYIILRNQGYQMVFGSIWEHDQSVFLRVRAVIKFILRATSTLENTDCEVRALPKLSASRKFSYSLLLALHVSIVSLANFTFVTPKECRFTKMNGTD